MLFIESEVPMCTIGVVHLLSLVQLFATSRTAACQASLSFTISQVCLNSRSWSQWCDLTISSSASPFYICLQSFQHQDLFLWGSSLHQVAKVSELSFRIDWCDLLAVQGTLKSLLQHHSSKPSIFQHSAFFMVQLSHPWSLRNCFKNVLIS